MEDKRIRWGILGLGNIAQRFSSSLSHSENGVLYAVASRSLSKAEAYADRYGCLAYDSYARLLEDPCVDVVYIALPHGLHKKWVLECIKAHKAVLCEKPCALNVAEIEEIVACARKEGVFFLEAMKGRYNRCMEALKKDLADGCIGELISIYADFCSDSDDLHRDCYLYEKNQGGVLLDVGPYPITFFMDLLEGEPRVINCTKIVDQNDVEHHMEGTLLWHKGVRTDLAIACDDARPRLAVLIGTKGRIEFPYYYRGERYTVQRQDGTIFDRVYPLEVDDMFNEIEEVHRCLKEGRMQSDAYSWSDSIKEMRILDRIKEEARTIKRICYEVKSLN